MRAKAVIRLIQLRECGTRVHLHAYSVVFDEIRATRVELNLYELAIPWIDVGNSHGDQGVESEVDGASRAHPNLHLCGTRGIGSGNTDFDLSGVGVAVEDVFRRDD